MVTKLDEIIAMAGGREVNISGWEDGTFFTCKLKRVSLLNVASEGKIPNGLMSTVMQLFEGDKTKTDKINPAEMAKVVNIFCKEALVEPTFEEVNEYLTDNQRMDIFNYTQKGLKAIEKFRKEQTDPEPNSNGETVPQTAE